MKKIIYTSALTLIISLLGSNSFAQVAQVTGNFALNPTKLTLGDCSKRITIAANTDGSLTVNYFDANDNVQTYNYQTSLSNSFDSFLKINERFAQYQTIEKGGLFGKKKPNIVINISVNNDLSAMYYSEYSAFDKRNDVCIYSKI